MVIGWTVREGGYKIAAPVGFFLPPEPLVLVDAANHFVSNQK